MIRFSAALVVVGLGLLLAGAITSELPLIYAAIAVSVCAAFALAAGVIAGRDELFGKGGTTAREDRGSDTGTVAGRGTVAIRDDAVAADSLSLAGQEPAVARAGEVPAGDLAHGGAAVGAPWGRTAAASPIPADLVGPGQAGLGWPAGKPSTDDLWARVDAELSAAEAAARAPKLTKDSATEEVWGRVDQELTSPAQWDHGLALPAASAEPASESPPAAGQAITAEPRPADRSERPAWSESTIWPPHAGTPERSDSAEQAGLAGRAVIPGQVEADTGGTAEDTAAAQASRWSIRGTGADRDTAATERGAESDPGDIAADRGAAAQTGGTSAFGWTTDSLASDQDRKRHEGADNIWDLTHRGRAASDEAAADDLDTPDGARTPDEVRAPDGNRDPGEAATSGGREPDAEGLSAASAGPTGHDLADDTAEASARESAAGSRDLAADEARGSRDGSSAVAGRPDEGGSPVAADAPGRDGPSAADSPSGLDRPAPPEATVLPDLPRRDTGRPGTERLGTDRLGTDPAVTERPVTGHLDTARPVEERPGAATPDAEHLDTRPPDAVHRQAPAPATIMAEHAPSGWQAPASPPTRPPEPGRPEAGPVQVVVVPGVPRYHQNGCILIRFLGADDVETITRDAAEAQGCVPCRACQPD